MIKRMFIRGVGGVLSFVSVLAGHRGAVAGEVVMTSTPNGGKNIVVNVGGGVAGGLLGWSCVPLVSGTITHSGNTLTCKSGTSTVTSYSKMYEYTDSSSPINTSGMLRCAGAQVQGNDTLRSWGCFCNATGLCAPTVYLKDKGFGAYSSGTVSGASYYPYATGMYYSMEQWRAGITGVTGTANGSVATFNLLYGGTTMANALGTPFRSGWGVIPVSNGDSTDAHYLTYPVETVYVTWTGCADGSYTSKTGVSGISLVVTALMQDTSGYADSYLYGMLQYGTPVYGVSTGVAGYSGGITGWTCPNNCPAASTVLPDGATYVSGKVTSDGFNTCVADLTADDDTGRFDLSGCEGP